MSKVKRSCLERFAIAGFSYYEGCIALKKLRVGDVLLLKAEPSNRFDKNAVEIYHKGLKLGYIPRDKNRLVSKFLLLDLKVFELRVQRICLQETPEAQVEVILYACK